MADSRYSRFAASACAMGRAVARATGPDFRDDFDWDAVSPDGLATRDAWAMATHWNTQLSGHVSVSVDDAAARFAVVPNIEWVDVWLGCMEEKDGRPQLMEATARAARASSLVWRALAACRGFGVSENPGFWKRLFSEMQQSPARCTSVVSHVREKDLLSDHTWFFSGFEFPRFRLNVEKHHTVGTERVKRDDLDRGIERVVRIYVGEDGESSGNKETHGGTGSEGEEGKEQVSQSGGDRAVDEMLRRLAPIVQTHRRCVAEPVEVVLWLDVTQLQDSTLHKLITIVNSTERNSRSTALGRLQSPQFVVKAVDTHPYRRENEAERLTDARALETPIASVSISRPRHVSLNYDNVPARLEFRDYLCEMLRVNSDRPGGVHNLTFNHHVENCSIPAILSALPHTRSLQTFELASWDGWNNDITLVDIGWLGYALFHPDSQSSSWRKLQLSGVWVARGLHAGADLALMARGNNLAIEYGFLTNDAAVDAYYTATVRARAVIYDGQEEHPESVVETLAHATRFDVCVTSTDVTSLDEWVFVIVPGYGKAWVRSNEIVDVVARPPGRPFLTDLIVGYSVLEIQEALMLPMLAGEQLEFLDVWFRSDDSCGGALRELAISCPRLQRLKIKLDRTDRPLDDLVFRSTLQELSLNVQLFNEPLEFSGSALSTLRDLRTLRMLVDRSPTNADMIDFVLPLLRTLPKVECFQWMEESSLWSCELREKLSYAQRRFVTHEVFGALNPSDCVVMVASEAPPGCILPFLSVVKRHSSDGSCAMGRLGRGLVLYIGGFFGRLVRREFVVHGRWFQRSYS